jgi:hypothetical protein
MRDVVLKAAVVLWFIVCLSGCMHMRTATQVGGPESSTWVYISVSAERRSGVFRCDVLEGQPRPVCVRAEMRY